MIGTTDILQGWNAIADFLACDVRTAKRWETDKGLPIRRTRRTPGEGRPNVYALISELEEWRASAGSLDLNSEQAPKSAFALTDFPAAPESNDAPAPAFSEISEPQPAPSRSSRHLSTAVIAAVGTVIIAAACISVWARDHNVRRSASANPTSAAPTSSPPSAGSRHAQELYLQGSYLLEQRTPETLQQAKVDLDQSIAANQDYAPAYAGLAKIYDLLREYSTMPSAQAYPLAKQYALRAIALDPKLADAHAALGYEEFFWEWDGADAEHEFKQAIELDPNCVTARHWYGAMLMHQARFQEALDQLDRAQALAPASVGVLGTRAYAIGLSGRRNEAADLLQDILTRVPGSAPLHFILAQLSLQQPRDVARYLDQMSRFAQLRHSDEETQLFNAAGAAYRQQGEAAMWRSMLEFERHLHPAPNHPTYFMVQCEAALGMRDDAIRDLGQLEQQHDELMIGLDIDSLLSPLKDDPAFERIVARIGLPRVPIHSEIAQLTD